MKFKKYLNDLSEETTSGDIATVDTKLDMVKRYKKKAKKAHTNEREDLLDMKESKYN